MNAVEGTNSSDILAGSALPPRYKGVPLIGALPELVSDPLGLLVHARERLGDLYEMPLPGLPVVILNHPRHVRHVFVERVTAYRKSGAFWDALRGYLGNGLLVNEGESWKHQRMIMEPVFRRQSLAGITDLMIQGIEDALVTWQTLLRKEEPFNIDRGVAAVSMSVSARTMFGAQLTQHEAAELLPAMTYVVDRMAKQMIADSLPRWVPRPSRRRYRKELTRIDERISRFIQVNSQTDSTDHCLLSNLLRLMDEQGQSLMGYNQLRDEALNLFGGAYETTKTTLAWTLHCLMEFPEVKARAIEEVDRVLAGRIPSFHDLANLVYMRMVIQEALRKYPPATWILRTATEDDRIDGYQIPAGTRVVLAVYALHHNPEFWPNPEVFLPERFTPEGSKQRVQFSWVPFGAGPRVCLGQHFAIMEAQLALALILQRYRITAWPGYHTKPQLRTTLKPKQGVFVRLEPT